MNNYIVFLQEHKETNGMMEDDPINFCQAMHDSNLEKRIEAMKEEYKSMQYNSLGTCSVTKRCETHWLKMEF